MDDTILIFTRKGMPSFIKEGGSGNWKVRPDRVNRLTYAVFCRNRHTLETVEGDEPHGAGFLVARISGVVPSSTRAGRSVIQFSECAEISLPELWPGYRVPTTYTSIANLGIEASMLKWREAPGLERSPQPLERSRETVGDVIRRYKVGLASELGISPDQVDVSVKG